jgi:NADH dehydrogenase [ubiquinone] 1 alpha subcomplex assembly factor 5
MNVLRTIRKSDGKLSAIAMFSRTFAAKQPPSYFVFDRETKKLQRNRTAYDSDYKVYDYLKEEVGYRVADRIFDVKRSFDQILDLGCQRGYVSKHLTKVFLEFF